jgi:hypothetical protein
MIAFRVTINGEHFALAGVPGTHMLTAILGSVVRTDAVVAQSTSDRVCEKTELDFSLGGLLTREDGSGERLAWGRIDLMPGDTVRIEVLETDEAEEPKERLAYAARRRTGQLASPEAKATKLRGSPAKDSRAKARPRKKS